MKFNQFNYFTLFILLVFGVQLKSFAVLCITSQPTNKAVCIGGSSKFIVGFSGTNHNFQWQYKNGNVWGNVSANLPTGASYITPTNDTLTVNSISATGIYSYRCLITGGGCTDTTVTVTLNVASVPVAPSIMPTIPGGSTVCIGATVSATISAGTGGAGNPIDTIQYTINGTNWMPYTSGTSITASTIGTNVLGFKTKRTATGSGCTTASSSVLYNVVTVPVAPTINNTLSNGTSVCLGATVSANISSGTGGAGNPTDTIQYTINGTNWLPYTSGTNITATTIGTSVLGFRTKRTATGSGCTTATSSVLYNVVAVPVAPTINNTLSNGASVCLGTTVLANISAGTGGAGTTTDIFESTIDGTNWLTYTSGTSITASTIGTSVLGFRTKRTATNSGCTTATSSKLYNVVAQPLSPTIITTLSNGTSVCIGATVSATFTAGTGGAGTTTDIFESTIDGTNWLAYSSGNNITATTTGNNVLGFRTKRTATGSGCATATSSVLYNVVAVPIAPTISATYANGATVCAGATVSATISAGTGGAGNPTDTIQYTINGTNWLPYTSGTSITASTLGTSVLGFRTKRTATNSGCTTATSSVLYNVVAPPVAQTINATYIDGSTICVGTNVSATFAGGSGGTGTINNIYESTVDGVNWTPYIPNNSISASVAGNNVIGFRTKRTATGGGCSSSNYITVMYNVVQIPTIILQPFNTAKCVGDSAIFTTAVNGGYLLTYQWQYFNGTSWNNVTNGAPLGAIYSNQTSSSLKVKGINNPGIYSYQCIVTSSGFGCNAPLISSTSNLTLNALPQAATNNMVSICKGSTASLSATGGIAYAWSPTTGLNSATISNPLAKPNVSTQYTVVVTNLNGCSSIATVQVNVNPLPIANAGTDINVCSSDSILLNASGGLSYSWSPSTGLSATNISNPLAKPALPTNYLVMVTNANGCTNVDSVSITINQPVSTIIIGNTSVCKNAYWESYSANSNGNVYQWSVNEGEIMYGQNTKSIYVHWLSNNTGSVNLHETSNMNGCDSATTLNVSMSNFTAPDTVAITLKSNNILICTDSTFSSYKWGYENKISGTPIYACTNTQYCQFTNFDSSSNYYWVIVGNGNGCETKSYYKTPTFNGVKNIEDLFKLFIYPNPANETIKIDYEPNATNTDLKIEIFNVLGEKVYSQKLNNTNGSASLNASQFPIGVYQINVSNQNRIIKSVKQIIQR